MDSEIPLSPLEDAKKHLLPFIKRRTEAQRIRRIIASHISTLTSPGGNLSKPISLTITSPIVESSPPPARSSLKELLRCTRSNVAAKNEYLLLSGDFQSYHYGVNINPQEPSESSYNPDTAITMFSSLIESRQKRDGLNIMLRYFQKVSQKPAASPGYLDENSDWRETRALPLIPAIVLNPIGSNSQPASVELHDLVDRLEKSVLRSKMQLIKEQNMLAHIQALDKSSTHRATKLDALGSTRNELINWIEGRLDKAEDSGSNDGEVPLASSPNSTGADEVISGLDLIQQQYFQYIKSRQALLAAATSSPATPKGSFSHNEMPDLLPNNTLSRSNSTAHNCLPYLAELILASNKQKTISQQKTHFTLTLAKQLKESNQHLVRLAEESHLLPSHPLPLGPSRHKNIAASVSASFEDGVSQHETSDSSHRAQGWAFAATSAARTTKRAISEKLDEGGEAILEGQETLLGLLGLIGEVETTIEGDEASSPGDIWGMLNGKLGAIGKDMSV